jgi:hypothetical protein
MIILFYYNNQMVFMMLELENIMVLLLTSMQNILFISFICHV